MSYKNLWFIQVITHGVIWEFDIFVTHFKNRVIRSGLSLKAIHLQDNMYKNTLKPLFGINLFNTKAQETVFGDW